MRLLSAAPILLALVTPADACHKFAIWKYPYPQNCGVVAETKAPEKPLPPERDMPLPKLDADFPPDALANGWEHLKAIGKLRENAP